MDTLIDGNILDINIEKEMKKSYIDYAMSVIVGRALPDVRDGLKPVHRRILYSMYENGMTSKSKFKKSARIVGDVLGKYHPHGDSSVYEAMVRLAQEFSTRYQLVDGHGNFGSIDGDSAAAMRYTEARMTKLSDELLKDINKDTVDFIPNYDDTLEEPTVFPSKFPALLVNGSSGIAVGMATNIPPHNLGEVIDATVAMIDNPEIEISELMQHVKGPDFPTGALIMGTEGIKSAYETGRGSVKMRSKTHIEELKNGKSSIIVDEIPYQVNKAKLIEKIADLVRNRKIEGITALRDESDRKGIRVVIELKRDILPQVILNQLYKQTQLQDSFGIINLSLVDNKPRVLNLKETLYYYIDHQKEVLTRRTKFELQKALDRAHIVEGLRKAIDNIDEITKIIKESKDGIEARDTLMERIDLTEIQANAILEMRLRKLTGLERDKLEEEYRDLLARIAYYKEILADENLLMSIIKEDLVEIKEKYSDERRTQIAVDEGEIDMEDLIAKEECIITMTNTGYIKRMNINLYKSQKRGGKGVKALNKKEEDFVRHLFITTTHHYLLFFTNKGKVLRLKAYEIPESNKQAKGTAIVNLMNLEKDENITSIIPIKEYEDNLYLFMGTKKGIVKKTKLSNYNSSRKDGVIGINLDDSDELIGVCLTEGKDSISLGTKKGISIRFAEDDVREVGRTARGVKGITLGKDDEVINIEYLEADDNVSLLAITEFGYGKRTAEAEYKIQARGGKGAQAIAKAKRNGDLVALIAVDETLDEEVMVISKNGQVIKFKVNDISKVGRVTKGVKIMNMADDDIVVAAALSKDDLLEDEE